MSWFLFSFKGRMPVVIVFIFCNPVNVMRHFHIVVKPDGLTDLFHAVSDSYFPGRDIIFTNNGIHFIKPECFKGILFAGILFAG